MFLYRNADGDQVVWLLLMWLSKLSSSPLLFLYANEVLNNELMHYR